MIEMATNWASSRPVGSGSIEFWVVMKDDAWKCGWTRGAWFVGVKSFEDVVVSGIEALELQDLVCSTEGIKVGYMIGEDDDGRREDVVPEIRGVEGEVGYGKVVRGSRNTLAYLTNK